MLAVQQDPEADSQQAEPGDQSHNVVDVEGELEAGQAAATVLSSFLQIQSQVG